MKTKEIENQSRIKLFLPEFNFNYNILNTYQYTTYTLSEKPELSFSIVGIPTLEDTFFYNLLLVWARKKDWSAFSPSHT